MSKKKITKKKVTKGKKVKATKSKKQKNYLVVYHVKNVNNRSEFKLLLDLDGKYRAYRRGKGQKLWELKDTYRTFRIASSQFWKLMEWPPWVWFSHPEKEKYKKLFLNRVKGHKAA